MENAEKNIDAECEILRAKDKHDREAAVLMSEYSAILKERDELRIQVIELRNKLEDALVF